MHRWADWLYNYCPSDAWGSEEKVTMWIEKRGWKGIDRANDEIWEDE